MERPTFLGSDGLTQTSANHLANIAREMYESLESKLDSIRLISKDFTLALNGESYRVENESSPEELSAAAEHLKEIASLKAFIAWLREGIKEKERQAFSREELPKPDFGKMPTFVSVLAEMTADEQARYYSLEAKCAAFGKFIHPDGHLAEARKTFFAKLKNPTTITGRGQDAEINTYSTAFLPEDVDNVFFSLQKKYRSAQAEFNALKAEIDSKLSKQTQDYLDRKERLLHDWETAEAKDRLAHQEKVKALKIIIPESLKETFGKVNAVAAQK